MADKTVEGMNAELDIFSAPVAQKTILSGDWVQFKPTQAINSESPLIFEISGTGDRYIDTSRTLLNLKVRVLNGKNEPIGDTEKFAPASYLLCSAFNEAIVEYNQNIVSQCHGLYHMKSYWESYFNFGTSARESHLTAALFYQDLAGSYDDPDAGPAKKRASFVRHGKTLELMGRLHCDVLNTPQYLLNGVNIRLTLRRNPDALLFLAEDNLSPKLIIDDATLYVRSVNLSPSILVAHAKILHTKPSQYHYRRTEMLHYTVSQGTFQKSIENILCGRTPIRIVMGLVKNSSFNGNYKENIFNFEHFNLNYLNLAINGATVGTKPLQPNYETGECMVPYVMGFFGSGICLADDGNTISREDYSKSNAIYAWDLTPDVGASESHWSQPQNGGLRIELGFSKALPTTVSLIILAEFRETLNIDYGRQCSLTYKG
jgi:hypothetical protein